MSTPSAPASPEQLLDLLLLGLNFLWDERQEPRLAASVFHAICDAGVLSKTQRKNLVSNAGFISLVMKNSEIMRGDRRPHKVRINELAAKTDKRLIMLIVPDSPLQYRKICSSQGYLLAISEAGLDYARGIAGQYAQLLDPAKFAHGWQSYKAQMRGIGAAAKDLADPHITV